MGLVVENMLPDLAFLNTSTNSNLTSSSNSAHELSMASQLFITVIYIIGIIGNLMALMHLCGKRTFKNSRHPLMLK